MDKRPDQRHKQLKLLGDDVGGQAERVQQHVAGLISGEVQDDHTVAPFPVGREELPGRLDLASSCSWNHVSRPRCRRAGSPVALGSDEVGC